MTLHRFLQKYKYIGFFKPCKSLLGLLILLPILQAYMRMFQSRFELAMLVAVKSLKSLALDRIKLKTSSQLFAAAALNISDDGKVFPKGSSGILIALGFGLSSSTILPAIVLFSGCYCINEELYEHAELKSVVVTTK